MTALVVSYARVDRPQVRELVDLLTAANAVEKAVFWDGHLVAGDDWFKQLKRHINKAGKLFVFWCLHSSRSKQVKKEYLYAIKRRKRVIPVLLDNTPLSKELAPIHGIDMRSSVRHEKLPVTPESPKIERVKGGLRRSHKKAGKFLKPMVGSPFYMPHWRYQTRMLKPIPGFGAATTSSPRRASSSMFRSPSARAATVRKFRQFLSAP
ncbi:MAG: toll/interleukin-1 receptor domain-containing protein [Vicinamibacterales bacterium]